jgi:hypothetical protein
MVFVYIFIIGLPGLLVFFTIKKIIKARAVQKHGINTHAVITHIALIKFSRGTSDNLTLEYSDSTGTRHAAKATTVPGQYKPGDTMPLKYLSDKPSCYTIDGMQQGQWVILVFCILLLAFTIFASFKIDEMLQGSNFHFSP